MDSLNARAAVVDDIDSSGGEREAELSTQEFQAVTKRLDEIKNSFIAHFGEADGLNFLEQVYETGSIEAGQPRQASPPRDRRDRAVTPQLPVGLEPHPYFDQIEASQNVNKKLEDARKRKLPEAPPIPFMIGIYQGSRQKVDSDGTRQSTLFPISPTDWLGSLQGVIRHLSSTPVSSTSAEKE